MKYRKMTPKEIRAHKNWNMRFKGIRKIMMTNKITNRTKQRLMIKIKVLSTGTIITLPTPKPKEDKCHTT